MSDNEKLRKYPSTDKFRVIDTIGVPHPFMIGSKHVAFALDNCGGMLGEAAIVALEETIPSGISCYTCNDRKYTGTKLTYKEHEQGLIIEVDDTRDLKDIDGLQDYLLSIKDMATKDGYAGFAFKQVEK